MGFVSECRLLWSLKKIQLWEICLDRRHLPSFKKIHHPFFDHISIKKYLQLVVWGFAALWVQKNYKDRRILMKQIANLRKMATSFRRKKHQDKRASEASEFLCTRFQLCTKHLETVSTIRNHFMFLQMVEKKDTNSLSETEANWTQSSIFFRTNFQFKNFPAFITFNRVCMIKPLLWIREKCVLSRNTDNYKVWNKFWVIGNLLRWTPFDIFQT